MTARRKQRSAGRPFVQVVQAGPDGRVPRTTRRRRGGWVQPTVDTILLAWMYRRQLAPWLLFALAYGVATQVLGRAHPVPVALFVGVIGTVLVVAATAEAKPATATMVRLGSVASAVYLLDAALSGTPWPVTRVGGYTVPDGVALVLLASFPWWRLNGPGIVQARGDVVGVWDTWIGNHTVVRDAARGEPGREAGKLAGSKLVPVASIPSGQTLDVLLPPGGKFTTNSVKAVALNIAAAYGKPAECVSIDDHPSKDKDKARMVYLRENPLATLDGVSWRGPTLKDGLISIGVYADGSPATYPIWYPEAGTTDLLICGVKGAGKTKLLDLLLVESKASGVMVDWLGDLKGGVSLPDHQDSVDWYGVDKSTTIEMLRAANRVIDARAGWMASLEWVDERSGKARKGRSWVEPSRLFPVLTVTIDEAPELFRDPVFGKEAARLAGSGAKRGRQVNVRFQVIAQTPLANELGGIDGTVLKEQLQAGMTIVFRLHGVISRGTALQGCADVHPEEIPDDLKHRGMAYLVGCGAKSVVMRTFFVEDAFSLVSEMEPTPLDEVSAKAAGNAYASRHQPGGNVISMPVREEPTRRFSRRRPLLGRAEDQDGAS